MIWHGGVNPETVYVGKGSIAEQIQFHRKSEEILKFSYLGLFVTWAKVSPTNQDGVGRFLTQSLSPKVGEVFPSVPPIPVNFPWP